MVQFKKTLVLSLAVLAIASQAHANGADVRAEDNRGEDRVAHNAADGAANVHAAVAQTSRNLDNSTLPRLAPEKKHALLTLMSQDQTIHSLVDEAVAQSKNDNLRQLNAAQIEA